jgi:hypothetical protein
MDLKLVVENNERVAKKIEELGFDLDSLVFICKDLIGLQSDLGLEIGDFKDLVYRLRNHYDHIQGTSTEMRVKCEDTCPNRITFQKGMGERIFHFQRCPKQAEAAPRDALFLCETCKDAVILKRQEIKSHVAHAHL